MSRNLNLCAGCVLFAVTLAFVLNPGFAVGEGGKVLPAMADKTIVAWVQLANTTQRAGAVVSLIDDEEHFDAIVFGEKTPEKWMAGSDFFRRTQTDQSGYALETADSNALIQIAAVYEKTTITLYRNGKQYVRYEVDKAQAFDQDVTVLLGLRYVGGNGEVGFLAGAIEEARLYGTALDASAIATLKPNEAPDPRPLGQWTFEDGTALDSMKTFPKGELRGHARIAGGKLHLDGKDSYVEIRRPRPLVVQGMFYKARSRQTGNMWDTWLYHHKGTYYLYYLANSGGHWNNISMASSPDGVHWKEIGRVLSKVPEVKWMGTGSTWKSPNYEKDRKFHMNFSWWIGPRQTIFFAESDDLVQWDRLDRKEYEFVQDTRWYKPNGRWDCIYTIPRPGGGLYGYWTATPKPETGGRFGFGETLNGVTWKALPPPKVQGVGGGEAGAVEKIGNKYYMMFGTGGKMVTLIADQPQGPFHAAKKNLHLLSGHTYFSRFFPAPDGVLVNHHAIARNRKVSFGLLKSTVLDKDGTLRLGWWKGNEKLKGRAKARKVSRPANTDAPIAMLVDTLNTDSGIIMEGRIKLPEAGTGKFAGLYISCDADHGSAIRIHAGGRAELGDVKADGSGFKAVKKVDREMEFGPKPEFRLIMKQSLLEFYLNDILIECFSLPSKATGRLGLVGDLSALKAWECQ
jgi:hypothetical protein